MAKISRTPFNASRMITESISSDKTLLKKSTGNTYFVTAPTAVAINIDYADKGCYYKFIIKKDTEATITITTPSLVGLMISDNGSIGVIEGAGTTLTIHANAKAGTYVDLVCDGTKWYARGMSSGSEFGISQ